MNIPRRAIVKGAVLLAVAPLFATTAIAESADTGFLMVAPTAGGKGVGHIAPSPSWPANTFVLDMDFKRDLGAGNYC